MSMKLKKALRELTIKPKRTILVIFALFLGIWGVGTVLVSYSILTKDLNANFQSTIPAQVILHSDDFDSLNLADFIALPEVETAELRDYSLHRIEVYPDVWIPLWLYGVEDFNRFNLAKIFQQEGNKVPEPGTILMERDGKHVSDIRIGSKPNIRIGSTNLQVPVSGICYDPAQAPATQDAFIYAYTDKNTYAQLTGLPNNRRLIARLNNVYSGQDVENVADKLVKQLGSEGINVSSIDIPPFNEHPHQWQLNTLLFLIGTIGLLAFLMGSVLVSQLVRAIMSSQVRQIGILKAIGATRISIIRIYTIMLLLMGLLGGLTAVPLAISSGKAFSNFVAGILNFDILTTSTPVYVLVLLVLASVLLPVLLSLFILLKGTGISAREALSDYGINQDIKSSNSGQIMKKFKLPGTFILAIRNTGRNSKRLAVTILSMALGVAIFSTGFNVRESLWNLLQGLKNELRYDVQVVINKPIDREKAMKPFESLQNVDVVEKWVGGRGEIESRVASTEKGAGIVALPYQSDLLALDIESGHWINTINELQIVMNQQAWALYGNPEVGSMVPVTVDGKTLKVKLVGIAQQFEKAKIYMDLSLYDSLFNPDHYVNSLMFVAKNRDYNSIITLKKDIENAIHSSGLDILYVMSQAERVKIIYDHLNIILSTILILSFLVLMVSAVGMASATGINIWERTREIGVMRAIGAIPRKIYHLFIYEGFIVSVLSIVLGVILAYPLSKIAAVFFGDLMLGNEAVLKYSFSPTGFWVTLCVTIIFAWMASMIPAKSAIKTPTHKALSYE